MCFHPIKVKNSESPVPCGRCPECRAGHSAGWAFRILQEFKSETTTSAHFLTLTYDESELPRNSKGYPTLDKHHVQAFIKRLRKYSRKKGNSRIRYYAAGEYGGQTERPHYHLIIFNASVKNIEKAWSYEQTERAEANRTNSLRRRKRTVDSVHSGLSKKTKNHTKK